MLTYDLSIGSGPLYKNLYDYIKEDIITGKITINEKMPSKRALARNLGVSTITVENAYDQLISEGYMYAVPKKGYFTADVAHLKKEVIKPKMTGNIALPQKHEQYTFDFSANKIDRKKFPFSVMARMMRETISMREDELLNVSPCGGVRELREAIAEHLKSFRGMFVDPNQIIIGAGTEYLYSLIVKLLGIEKVYCIENPGYKKLLQIYESNHAVCRWANIDDQGIMIDELRKTNADIAHINPTHHFPTGITMPIHRRYELLAWANEKKGRYIIEDDYDSEFRLNGKPLPTMQSIDASGKVIYLNTFSKSLTSTIRISYMILPEELANLFYEKLSFYSCTVSTFEQYALAAFISQGYFEKHINRMRLHYGRKRNQILDLVREIFSEEECRIIENDSGLHFIMEMKTTVSDQMLKERLLESGIHISSIGDYDLEGGSKNHHRFICCYSSIEIEAMRAALIVLKNVMGLQLL